MVKLSIGEADIPDTINEDKKKDLKKLTVLEENAEDSIYKIIFSDMDNGRYLE